MHVSPKLGHHPRHLGQGGLGIGEPSVEITPTTIAVKGHAAPATAGHGLRPPADEHLAAGGAGTGRRGVGRT